MEHLKSSLDITFAQLSQAGAKSENQDTIGARIPDGTLLTYKGIAIAIADGVSTSAAAKQASQSAITGFLGDYYATPDTWRTQQSATRVIQSLNRYLWGLGANSPRQEGLLTTFSAIILKSNQVFCFHVGDSRIYRLRHGQLEQLTRDHTQKIDKKTTYLTRALGADDILEIDMQTHELMIGDTFILTTDGIHDNIQHKSIESLLNAYSDNLEDACSRLLNQALENNSQDNLSIQICRVNNIGAASQSDTVSVLARLPFAPLLSIGQTLDGLCVKAILQESERSQVYRVEDADGNSLVMKTPSSHYSDDIAYIERFVMESWIGIRLNSDCIVKVVTPPKPRTFLYYLTEYLKGPTLTHLIKERAPLDIPDAIDLITGIIKGVRAFHRKDTLHQDIKPDNIIVTSRGPVIIDFGSSWVAGISEVGVAFERDHVLGTLDYSAPEYRYGAKASSRSDQFSVAILMYEMLTHKRPYGEAYGKAMHLKAFQKLRYRPAATYNPLVPYWIDKAIAKAVSIHPEQRYESFSEFLLDLKRPNPLWQNPETQPLLQRHPLRFWQVLAAMGWFIALMLLLSTAPKVISL
ncbi:bifunctional protein-serine/threonine kinase/phosphatase [Marinagarivorans algicola]|uniref:bifunctional protein-serine/threonine kinase/phosphatase n=1 Tax=Marinagarivorans algicola TaxID=1513270 RepID=UPI0006B9D505|nr:bifunctional protein-serine/threonine kinase/phosphatase [Marinagarivorans algicola]